VDRFLTGVSESPELRAKGAERLRKDLLKQAVPHMVVDWGMAKAGINEPARSVSEGLPEPNLTPSLADAFETQAGSAVGTPAYMSPEQASGRLDLVGPASDIYSLGATLYTILTGRPPIEGKDTADILRKAQRGDHSPPRQLKPDVSPALDAVCRKAMALAASARYATALELAADVERWLADEPVAAYREPWTARAGRWVKRHRVPVTSVWAALMMLVVGFLPLSLMVIRPGNLWKVLLALVSLFALVALVGLSAAALVVWVALGAVRWRGRQGPTRR
jgi:hypothetical protein